MQDDTDKKLNFPEKCQLAGMRLLLSILRLLGYRGIRLLSKCLGTLIWYCAPERRHLATESVERHLGVSRDEAKRVAKASFWQNSCSFMEAALVGGFHLYHNRHLFPFGKYFDVLIQDPRPAVAITAHLGGWELLAGLLPEIKPGNPQAVIVRSQRNRALNALIFGMRGSGGGVVVGHRNAAPVVSKILRQNGTTAFLVDHNATREEGIFIPFLGEMASVNMGPAMLALRAKAKIYPVFLIRHPEYVYELVTYAPLDTAGLEGSISERVRQIAEFYTQAVEKVVREYPEQWFWMHHRWKTKPKPADYAKAGLTPPEELSSGRGAEPRI